MIRSIDVTGHLIKILVYDAYHEVVGVIRLRYSSSEGIDRPLLMW
jgi:hypothetical protein